MAKKVARAPPGRVAFERVSEQQFLGQVLELPETAMPAAPGGGGETSSSPGLSPARSPPPPSGLIRYLPDPGRVLHIPFRSADVEPGRPPLEAGCFAFFNVCTDTRAEASAALTASGGEIHPTSGRVRP